MSNRFQRRTSRNTRALVRIAAWQAQRDEAERAERAALRLAIRRRLAELSVPPRPDSLGSTRDDPSG